VLNLSPGFGIFRRDLQLLGGVRDVHPKTRSEIDRPYAQLLGRHRFGVGDNAVCGPDLR
jgi:hypothetical protein